MAQATESLPSTPAMTLGTRSSRPRGLAARTLIRVLRDPVGVVGLAILAALSAVALLAPIVASFDPLEIGAGTPLEAPSRAHPFGTDDLGRDVYSRVVHGGRISLWIAVASATAALAMAVPLGLLAGYGGGYVDAAIARLFDTIFAFPSILIGIGFVAVLGTSLRNVVLAVAIINIPTLGRLTRVAILAQKSEEYVEAARSIGASGARVAARHILPNATPPLVVQTALVMGEAVLLEAAFSFLGLGSRPPTPSWGVMLNEGRNFLAQAWWLGFFPGVAITLMILALNALADALRSALNPRRL
ncbi:MAG: peptide/nickel transport system permease protein [Thermomicrobiales bacterium]|jgi:peptide/nickel transport system permease protein|nr:peptide/nickel transport system permease protein [Thermomicrobiales bacterium]MEA2528591.1 peptide/nickel transport system permease protein [Thermomicrobiales bacterium]MEA2585229.1 peptide/nickel transport system permease protein [Thermomicrobiales bacterium]MEA2593615.1 peptide/nickel transport system permease protein [Thermomicrobiales bacterium]